MLIHAVSPAEPVLLRDLFADTWVGHDALGRNLSTFSAVGPVKQGTNWMLLLIDADLNPATGWNGYDYLINQRVLNERVTTLMRYRHDVAKGQWVEVAQLNYRYSGKALELAVPRRLLGLNNKTFSFDFHWCDNPIDLEDPISLCTSGDSAPDRRFNYRCIWRNRK